MNHACPHRLSLGAAIPLALACVLAAQQLRATGIAATVPQAQLPLIIVTAAPGYDSLAALRGGERFPKGAQLMLLRAGQLQPLVPQFAASADASVSFDATSIVFSGKQLPGDPWQIWTIPVSGGTPLRVLTAPEDLIRPLWMPSGRLAYARRTARGFALESAQLDGSAVQKLSFVPGNFIPDDVLRDGRVLFETGFPLGAGHSPEMLLVYADGSGVESVRCDHANAGQNDGREHGRQLASGDIVFTHGNRLARFTSALANEAAIPALPAEYAGDVAELPGGHWLISLKKHGASHFSLAAWQPGASSLQLIASDHERDLIEPVIVAPRPTPNRHPSGLHDWTTGNLLALDAHLTRSGRITESPTAVRVETIAPDGRAIALGVAPVEQDGSFFIQATGDRPLRFVLLDEHGQKIRAEEGWFWVRRGEQRICVGCHTGPERSPDNRVPQVLLRTTTPVDVTGPTGSALAGGH